MRCYAFEGIAGRYCQSKTPEKERRMVTITRNDTVSYAGHASARSLPPGAGLFIGGAISLGLWVMIAGIVLIV